MRLTKEQLGIYRHENDLRQGEIDLLDTIDALEADIAAAYERGKHDSAEICRAKAVYANRSGHGKEEFAKGLLVELENILRDTAKNIEALQDRGAGGEQ
jgi:hypothetical protein